jgi:hypothetical protein
MTSVALAGTDPLAFLASLVREDGTRWGETAQAWQWDDAAAILDLHKPPNHFMTRPRGGSKTTDVGGISLAVIITQAPRGSRCYALAADRDQGRLLLDAIRGFATRTPSLQTGLEFTTNRVAISRDFGGADPRVTQEPDNDPPMMRALGIEQRAVLGRTQKVVSTLRANPSVNRTNGTSFGQPITAG